MVKGAGEHGDIAVTRTAWIRVVVPHEAASRAANAQAAAELGIEAIGVCGHVWECRGPGMEARARVKHEATIPARGETL